MTTDTYMRIVGAVIILAALVLLFALPRKKK